MSDKTSTPEDASSFELKAGMEGFVDKDKIQKIIKDATRGTAFDINERKKQLKRNERINEKLERAATFETDLTPAQRDELQASVDREIQFVLDNACVGRFCHIDMDAFHAAVETLDTPWLRHVPMAVGSEMMLGTSNYRARKFGIRSGMPGFIARRLCPHLTIVPSHFDKYERATQKVREVAARFDPDFVSYGGDELCIRLDHAIERRLGGGKQKENDERSLGCWDQDVAEYLIVCELRHHIFQATKLTASAGVGPTRTLAKIASNFNKPNGQHILEARTPEQVRDYAWEHLSVRQIPGIGKVSEQMLGRLGVKTCKELYDNRVKLAYTFRQNKTTLFFLQASVGLVGAVPPPPDPPPQTPTDAPPTRKTRRSHRVAAKQVRQVSTARLCKSLKNSAQAAAHMNKMFDRTLLRVQDEILLLNKNDDGGRRLAKKKAWAKPCSQVRLTHVCAETKRHTFESNSAKVRLPESILLDDVAQKQLFYSGGGGEKTTLLPLRTALFDVYTKLCDELGFSGDGAREFRLLSCKFFLQIDEGDENEQGEEEDDVDGMLEEAAARGWISQNVQPPAAIKTTSWCLPDKLKDATVLTADPSGDTVAATTTSPTATTIPSTLIICQGDIASHMQGRFTGIFPVIASDRNHNAGTSLTTLLQSARKHAREMIDISTGKISHRDGLKKNGLREFLNNLDKCDLLSVRKAIGLTLGVRATSMHNLRYQRVVIATDAERKTVTERAAFVCSVVSFFRAFWLELFLSSSSSETTASPRLQFHMTVDGGFSNSHDLTSVLLGNEFWKMSEEEQDTFVEERFLKQKQERDDPTLPSVIDGLTPSQRQALSAFFTWSQTTVSTESIAVKSSPPPLVPKLFDSDQCNIELDDAAVMPLLFPSHLVLPGPRKYSHSFGPEAKPVANAVVVPTLIPLILVNNKTLRRPSPAGEECQVHRSKQYYNSDGGVAELFSLRKNEDSPLQNKKVAPLRQFLHEQLNICTSSIIPRYKPTDVIQNVRNLLKGKRLVPMTPYLGPETRISEVVDSRTGVVSYSAVSSSSSSSKPLLFGTAEMFAQNIEGTVTRYFSVDDIFHEHFNELLRVCNESRKCRILELERRLFSERRCLREIVKRESWSAWKKNNDDRLKLIMTINERLIIEESSPTKKRILNELDKLEEVLKERMRAKKSDQLHKHTGGGGGGSGGGGVRDEPVVLSTTMTRSHSISALEHSGRRTGGAMFKVSPKMLFRFKMFC